MDIQQLTEAQRTERAAVNAAKALMQLAGDPDRYIALLYGTHEHGTAFTAFLLIPEVAEIPACFLQRTFKKAYCFSADRHAAALNKLLVRLGWRATIEALYGTLGVSDFLSRDVARLQEVLREGYVFVPTYDACHVFDLAVIRNPTRA